MSSGRCFPTTRAGGDESEPAHLRRAHHARSPSLPLPGDRDAEFEFGPDALLAGLKEVAAPPGANPCG
jgi:hypothetical protein